LIAKASAGIPIAVLAGVAVLLALVITWSSREPGALDCAGGTVAAAAAGAAGTLDGCSRPRD
jgi:hypothetical protein